MDKDNENMRKVWLAWIEKAKKCPKCGVEEVVNTGGGFGKGIKAFNAYMCLNCWHKWNEQGK